MLTNEITIRINVVYPVSKGGTCFHMFMEKEFKSVYEKNFNL